MTPVSPDGRRPLLVVPFGPRVPPLQIAEAASGLCSLLWLVDENDPEDAGVSPLLRKVGTVVNIGGLSPAEIVSILRGHSPDGVFGHRDTDIAPLSFLATELGLDYHTPEVARRLVDKFFQREACLNAGLPTPLCWEVPADPSPATVKSLAAMVRFPAVLKPRTANGSKYATPVSDPGDLVRQLAALPPRAGGEAGMFVEQYLPSLPVRPTDRFADYLSVESLVARGEISHFATTGRFPMAEPFRETGTFIPADLPKAQETSVLEVATAALRALGVQTGGFHTEIKLTPGGPRVIEVNGRLGGAVPEMLFHASGVSVLRLLMRVALGEPVVVDRPITCSRVGWRFMFQLPMSARRVISIDGLDRLAERPGVNSVFLNRAPGDPVDWREGTGHYVYEATGVSADYDALWEVNRFLHEEVSIAYE